MKRTRALLLAALPAALVLACTKEEEPRLAPLPAWEVTGARVWQRITAESDFENWAFWPGHEELRPGQSPHGKYHEVYVNNTLREALPVASGVAPHGSIIVKENYDAAKNRIGYTVMVKAEGYNPEVGDWFWASYDITGNVAAEGKPGGCITCHAGMKDNDYVILRRLDAPLPAK